MDVSNLPDNDLASHSDTLLAMPRSSDPVTGPPPGPLTGSNLIPVISPDLDSPRNTRPDTDHPSETGTRMTTQPSSMDNVPDTSNHGVNSGPRTDPPPGEVTELTMRPYIPNINRAPSDGWEYGRRRTTTRRRGAQRRYENKNENSTFRPVPRDFKKFFIIKASRRRKPCQNRCN